MLYPERGNSYVLESTKRREIAGKPADLGTGQRGGCSAGGGSGYRVFPGSHGDGRGRMDDPGRGAVPVGRSGQLYGPGWPCFLHPQP